MYTFNSDLVDDLARQKVVLFLGSGVSSSAITASGTRIKGWDAFLRDISSRVAQPLNTQITEILEKKDYLLAAELLKRDLQDDWEFLLTSEFGQNAQPSRLHESLINLNQRLIFTTNFDKLIESCWGSKIGQSSHLPTIMSGINGNTFRILRDHSGKYLIKLHGCIDSPESIIFSRSDYIKMAFGNIMYSSFMDVMLLSHTFLFIGFSMDDPAISSIMEMYTLRYPNMRPHYILSPSGTPDNIKNIYLQLRRLKVEGSKNP